MKAALVKFFTKGEQTVSISAEEFIRRFLLHVLPSGFFKIRHYGLLAPANVNTRLQRAYQLLEKNGEPSASMQNLSDEIWQKLFSELTGIDLMLCPLCGKGPMIRRPLPKLPADSRAREPPEEETS